MGRRAARATHLALSLLGLALFAVFVIPRWWVLTGDIPGTLATVGRIVTGFPIAAGAVPVALILQRSIKEDSTVPELALRLRAWSGVLHVVAGVLIVLTAIAEIWLTSPKAGPWLFAVYGGAGAIAILAMLAFWLSFVAEQPPGPPKPAKAKKDKPKKEKRRGRGKNKAAAEDGVDSVEVDETVEVEAVETESGDGETVEVEDVEVEDVEVEDVEVEDVEAEAETPADDLETTVETVETEAVEVETDEATPTTGLQNKRPTGKRRHRLRR